MTQLRFNSSPTYWRCEPGWFWHSRPLGDHLLWCVLDGVGELTLEGQTEPLGPGSCAVFRPGDAPMARHDPHRRLLVFGMHFDIDAPDEAPHRGLVQVQDRTLLGALARRCDRSFRRGGPLGARHSLLCLEQLLCLLGEEATYDALGPVDAELDRITEAMRQDPSRRWTVTELARQAALSRAQFTRRFIAYTGLTPARYLINVRLVRAHELLTQTNMTVTQIAAALGYIDVAYFSRQYKRHTGRSPSVAR
ncbi:AraC family transcriptional regulator [Micromonospora sp. CPCC 206061]|uniref:AraC family transcriptional regulator n=1 Tax=Micromonospora sp. CPCC 206061 TaxID=3122410 RepID=UPI002FF2B7FA